MSDPAGTPPSRTPDPGDITRWPLYAAGALVVIGIVAMYFVMRPTAPPPTQTTGSAPRTSEGRLEGPDAKFAWSHDPRADVYRIEVYDASSHLLAAAVLRDTSILASALLPDSAHVGMWRVVPVSAGGTELPATAGKPFIRP
jgi:hypothetical protein